MGTAKKARGKDAAKVPVKSIGMGARLIRLAVVFVALIVLFVVALTIVYALPQQRIIANLQNSYPQLQGEGSYPVLGVAKTYYRLDNYTDAMMLDMAIARPEKGGALAVAMGGWKGSGADPMVFLGQDLSGQSPGIQSYAYYWHGYQLALRPALLFLRYDGVRYFNLLLLSALAVAVGLMLYSKVGPIAAAALFLALVINGFWLVPMNMEYSPVVYVMFAAAIAVLVAADKGVFDRFDLEIFFVTGMLAAFVDLLTAPMMTLGMPLAIAIVLLRRIDPKRAVKADVLLVVKGSAAWAVGYAASWVTKMAIGNATIGEDVLKLAGSQILFRTGLDGQSSGAIGTALVRNLTGLFPLLEPGPQAMQVVNVPPLDPASAFIVVVAVIAILAAALWLLLANRSSTSTIRNAAPVLLVVPLPYIWMMVVNNHSSIHYFFTYRMQVFAVFAVIYFLLSCVDFERLRLNFASLPLPGVRKKS